MSRFGLLARRSPAQDKRKLECIGKTYIDTQPQHYSFTFTMNYPTDMNTRVVFNAGQYNHDVYIDNISLKCISAQ